MDFRDLGQGCGQPEARSVSFVIRIWVEQASQSEKPWWRGQMTDVASGARRYFSDLAVLPVLIAPYLAELGVPLGLRLRLRCWLLSRHRSG